MMDPNTIAAVAPVAGAGAAGTGSQAAVQAPDSAALAAHQAPPARHAATADAADAQSFASMVRGAQAADGSRQASAVQAASDPSSTTLGNAIRQGYVLAGEESARQAARLESLRQDMFAAIHTGNTSDVVYQAMLLQTQSLELFSSINVTSSIGSAGTNLFNSLLKNQQ
ncbi:hypothetical protein [Cupriavidus sp. U2]|uniref:hypothetical protein n=1 Tax=Cupriavidus sp. U2 TaxID=2920269 RepID=UPI001E56BE24|nr:hypothetical protein [Cupriavidus sp. U2]